MRTVEAKAALRGDALSSSARWAGRSVDFKTDGTSRTVVLYISTESEVAMRKIAVMVASAALAFAGCATRQVAAAPDPIQDVTPAAPAADPAPVVATPVEQAPVTTAPTPIPRRNPVTSRVRKSTGGAAALKEGQF